MKKYLEKIKDILDKIEIGNRQKQIFEYYDGLNEILKILKKCKKGKNALYICGNGGSAGIAQHMTGDFLKNGGFRTYSLYGLSTITCISNDLSYKYVFSKQLELLALQDDVLIAISSSGESENIYKAINVMKSLGGKVITFTGFGIDNKIRAMGDVNVYVPSDSYGIVESIHNLILQELVDEIVDEDGVAMKLEEVTL